MNPSAFKLSVTTRPITSTWNINFTSYYGLLNAFVIDLCQRNLWITRTYSGIQAAVYGTSFLSLDATESNTKYASVNTWSSIVILHSSCLANRYLNKGDLKWIIDKDKTCSESMAIGISASSTWIVPFSICILKIKNRATQSNEIT